MPVLCPLLFLARRGAAECQGEECAWYVRHENPNSEGCAIKELSDSLKTISLNMPHPE